MRLLITPILENYYKSTVLADALQDRVSEIYNKAKNPADAGRQVTKLFVNVNYPSLGMLMYILIAGISAVLFTLPLFYGSTVLQLSTASYGLGSFVQNICRSPYAILNEAAGRPDAIVAFAAPILVGAATYLHDSVFTHHSAVSRRTFDQIILLAVIVVSVFIPLGFSVYWSIFEAFGILQSLITRKLFHVNIKNK